MEFSRYEFWSGFPFSVPGHLPDPGIEPTSPASPALAGGFFTTVPPGKLWIINLVNDPFNNHLFIKSLYLHNLPSMQEMWVQSLGQEDPLEEELATHSSILAWGILWTEEPAGLESMGRQTVGHDLATKRQQILGF